MPYKFAAQHKKMRREDDGRVKLPKHAYREIYDLYNIYGAYSQKELAEMYGVSKRLIGFIVNPESYERNKELAKNRNYYPGKDRWREIMKTHRKKKRKLELEGKLID